MAAKRNNIIYHTPPQVHPLKAGEVGQEGWGWGEKGRRNEERTHDMSIGIQRET